MNIYGWCCEGGKQYIRMTKKTKDKEFEFEIISAIPNKKINPFKITIPTEIINKIKNDIYVV